MKSTKQHYEEWKHVLPNFTEEQKRKLYFMMNDYARDYHESEVKKLNIPAVIKSVCCDKCKKELKPIYLCTDCLKEEMDKKQTVL